MQGIPAHLQGGGRSAASGRALPSMSDPGGPKPAAAQEDTAPGSAAPAAEEDDAADDAAQAPPQAPQPEDVEVGDSIANLPEGEAKRGRGRPRTRWLPGPGQSEFTVGCKGCTGATYLHNAECRRKNGGDLTLMMRDATETTPQKPKEKQQRREITQEESASGASSSNQNPALMAPPIQEFSMATPQRRRAEKRAAAVSPGALQQEAIANATPERHGEK